MSGSIQDCLINNSFNFIDREFLPRVATFARVPLAAISCALNGVAGVGTGFAAIATGGMRSSINNKAHTHLYDFGFIASTPYRLLLRTVNLNAKFPSGHNDNANKPVLYNKIGGRISELLVKAKILRISENFFERQVAARLSYALFGVAAIVARVAKGVIGAIAIPLSFLTLGKLPTLNHVAEESLKLPLIIHNLFFSTLLTINPWAFD